jgi:hypothetical protein
VPTHVIGEEGFVSLIGRGTEKPMADASAPLAFGYDISVMAIEGELATHCGKPYETISRNIKALLSSDMRAQVNTVNPDGTVSRIPLTIVDQSLTHLHVKPSYETEHLVKGMSGSMITVKGQPLGLLLAVESKSGVGKAIRIDRALETVSPFFRSPSSAKAIVKQDPMPVHNQSSKNLLTQAIKWTAMPLDGDHRAQNLLSTDPTAGPWIAKTSRFPVQLIFSVDSTSSSNGYTLIASGSKVFDSKILAKRIEVLIDPTGSHRWRSIGILTIPKNGQAKIAIPPLRIRKLMLNVYDNWGGPGKVAIGRVFLAEQ